MQLDAQNSKQCSDFSLPHKNIECIFFDNRFNEDGAVFIFRNGNTTINFRLRHQQYSDRKYCVDVKVNHQGLKSPWWLSFDEPRVFPYQEGRYKDEELQLKRDKPNVDGYDALINLIQICLNIIRVNRDELYFPLLK